MGSILFEKAAPSPTASPKGDVHSDQGKSHQTVIASQSAYVEGAKQMYYFLLTMAIPFSQTADGLLTRTYLRRASDRLPREVSVPE